jgi:hypothetical protein
MDQNELDQFWHELESFVGCYRHIPLAELEYHLSRVIIA